jgi:hypothetical protein
MRHPSILQFDIVKRLLTNEFRKGLINKPVKYIDAMLILFNGNEV